jgi:hypothetical protein
MPQSIGRVRLLRALAQTCNSPVVSLAASEETLFRDESVRQQNDRSLQINPN